MGSNQTPTADSYMQNLKNLGNDKGVSPRKGYERYELEGAA